MKERFAPAALLVAVGIAIPFTHDALRSAAAVTLLALVIPAWRGDLAAWFIYS